MQHESQNKNNIIVNTIPANVKKNVFDAYIALGIGLVVGAPLLVLAIFIGISQIGASSYGPQVDILASVSFVATAIVSAFIFYRKARSVRYAPWIFLLAISHSVIISFLVTTFTAWLTAPLHVDNLLFSAILGGKFMASLMLAVLIFVFGLLIYCLASLSNKARREYTLITLVILTILAGVGFVYAGHPSQSSIFNEDSLRLRADTATVEKAPFQIYAPSHDTGYTFKGITTPAAVSERTYIGLSFQKGKSKQAKITLEQQDFKSVSAFDLQPLEDYRGNVIAGLYGERSGESSGYTKIATRKGDTYVAIIQYPSISVIVAQSIFDSLEPVVNNRLNNSSGQ